MRLAATIVMALMLTGCAANEQRIVLSRCLDKCAADNVACISACGNLLKGGCQ